MSRLLAMVSPILLVASLLPNGCASGRAAPRPAAPAVRYAPPADRYVRSVLLDFETPTDAAFVDAVDATPTTDPTTPGNRTLRVADATIRLGALLRGRTFPGAWDLIGLRVYAPGATKVTAALDDAGVTLASADADVAAGAWRTMWMETAALAATRPASAPSTDGLTLTIRAAGAVLIDDVALAQGRTVVADSAAAAGRFHVERNGLGWRATLGGRALCTLPAAPFAVDGYRPTEANAARVVWAGPDGATVCADRLGRVIRAAADGGGTPPAPASVGAVDGAARLVRNAPGDRDNDGYDESRGCFTLRATGDRFTVRLDPVAANGTSGGAPGSVVLDIDGLRADGVASVYVQGELIGTTTRTTCADGGTRTIVELPMRIERPVEVDVSVR